MEPQQNSNMGTPGNMMNNIPPAPQPTPAPAPAPAPMPENNGSSSGPIIGVIIVLVAVILVGLYFLGKEAPIVEDEVQDSAESITTQSDSDETDSIENDLNNTDVEVDADINAS